MSAFTIHDGRDSFSMEETARFLAGVFPHPTRDPLEHQLTVLGLEPSTRPENFILARDVDGRLAGVVRMVERTLVFDDGVLDACGLTSISVSQAWRGSGLAGRMIKAACEEAARRGVGLAYLHARRALDGYYRRFAFWGINRYVTLEPTSTPTPGPSLVLEPWDGTPLPGLMSLYDTTYRQLHGSVVRGPGQWDIVRDRLESSGGALQYYLLLPAPGQPFLGYALCQGDVLLEFCAPGSAHAAAWRSLHAVGVRLAGLHPAHPFIAHLRGSGNTILHDRVCLDGGYMGRITDMGALLMALAEPLRRRAAALGVARRILRLNRYALDLTGATVTTDPGPFDLCCSPQEACVRVLLGACAVEEAPCALSGDDPALVRCLFPDRRFHTSPLDEI